MRHILKSGFYNHSPGSVAVTVKGSLREGADAEGG